MNNIQGTAYHCGDCVNTDVMSPGRYEPFEGRDQLARVALVDYDSETPFVDEKTGLSPYTVIFAGEEFGCGSSRETAPQALAYAGAKAVIAKSFARIFFRNCVNMGLLLPIQHDHPFDEGVIGRSVLIDPERRTYEVDGGETYHFAAMGPIARIVAAGGLTNLTNAKLEKRAR